jgi:hypothetical protein
MSRYTIKHPTLEIAVGWDNPLGTLFAFVADPAKDDPDDIVMWVGTGSRNDIITNVQDIRDKLKRYTELPDDIAQSLQLDMGNSTDPTPLQRYIHAIMHDIERTQNMTQYSASTEADA